MIDEAIGKILGMAMAYGVSAMGMFLAYANYRKRTVKADKIMSGTAWMVVGVTALAIAGAVFVVAQLAQAPDAAPVTHEVKAELPAAPVASSEPQSESTEPRQEWPLVGIVVPASIFLLATWLTAGLHRRFSHGGQ